MEIEARHQRRFAAGGGPRRQGIMLGPVGKIAGILDERFDRWVQGLEARHLAELTFQELARSVRALSSTYVERRRGLGSGAALAGGGKRAAFALFYGPLHYLLIREIVRALPGATDAPPILMDLGCGIGTSGAAWAAACEITPRIIGIDRNPWALREAAHTYRSFGLHADTTLEDLAVVRLRKPPVGIIAAFTVNELADEVRSALRRRLLDRARRGDRVLVVEPVSRRVTPWWNDWCAAFVSAGGRADEWRVSVPLPAIVAKLDRAAGLNHGELTGRSLWL